MNVYRVPMTPGLCPRHVGQGGRRAKAIGRADPLNRSRSPIREADGEHGPADCHFSTNLRRAADAHWYDVFSGVPSRLAPSAGRRK